MVNRFLYDQKVIKGNIIINVLSWPKFQYDIYFIGNAGGYLGLFLGYALLNLPDFLQESFNWICPKCKEAREWKRKCRGETMATGLSQ